MSEIKNDQRIMQVVQGTYRQVYNSFLMDRNTRGLSKRTIQRYIENWGWFFDYLDRVGVIYIREINTEVICMYLLELSTHRNKGGVRIIYGCIKVFLNWCEIETDGEFINPIKKIKLPRGQPQLLDPAKPEDIKAILEIANLRDRAVILTLQDTGVRASEFIGIMISDFDLITGSLIIRHGKGDKPRTVYLGREARCTVRKLSINGDYLFHTKQGDPLTYAGLRCVLRRLCKQAGIKLIPLHAFRRSYALSMLRSGVNVYTIQQHMGHLDLQILTRYLKQTENNLQSAHQRSSPADRLKV